MRWTKPKPPTEGECRLRRAFLWFPKTIDRETRWLERATWTEKAIRRRMVFPPPREIRGYSPRFYSIEWTPWGWGDVRE